MLQVTKENGYKTRLPFFPSSYVAEIHQSEDLLISWSGSWFLMPFHMLFVNKNELRLCKNAEKEKLIS